MLFGGALEGKTLFYGGMNWQSFAFALWESFIAIAFSIGIIAFFKKYLDINTKCTKLLAENAFGMYIFHTPFIIAISLILKWWIISPLIKCIAVTLCTFVICFAFSILIRRIKVIKIILK
jgi:surface polysaccharide O-acyltransferase-like enzyme